MTPLRPLIMAQALSPVSRTAFSEASLAGTLQKQVPTVVLCRKWAVDYSFARSFGLTDIIEYEPQDFYRAWRDQKHWLREVLSGVTICHLNGYWRWEDHFLARLCVKSDLPYLVQPRGALLTTRGISLARASYSHFLGKYILRHATKVIALSHFEQNHLVDQGVDENRIEVIPNGVSSPSFLGGVSLAARTTPGFPVEKYFFYLGRLEPGKNLLFLVDVFHEYVRQGGTSSLYLMGPSQQEYHHVLQRRIRQLQLDRRVSILSPSYDEARWQWMARSNGVVYPTMDEVFGRVPFEALSAGTLAIVPDSGGSAEYLRPLLPQCVYRHDDPSDFCRLLFELDRLSPKERGSLVTRAKKWVATELDWENICQRVIRLYAQIAGNGATALSPQKSATSVR